MVNVNQLDGDGLLLIVVGEHGDYCEQVGSERQIELFWEICRDEVGDMVAAITWHQGAQEVGFVENFGDDDNLLDNELFTAWLAKSPGKLRIEVVDWLSKN